MCGVFWSLSCFMRFLLNSFSVLLSLYEVIISFDLNSYEICFCYVFAVQFLKNCSNTQNSV